MSRPPHHLHFLRAFEAVARNRSFTRAAEELCISQAAVSQQIKSLEHSLGTDLIIRANRRLILTRAGEILLPAVQSAIHRISDALDEVRALKMNPQIRMKVSQFLLTHWLEPRLHDFARLHPNIDLRVSHFYQSLNAEAFARDEVDLVLCWGEAPWPGLTSDMLFTLELTPVCSPAILQAKQTEVVTDFSNYTLLRSYYDWWADWAKATGASIDLDGGQYIYDSDALIQAALDGIGVALVPLSLGTVEHLRSGRLVRMSNFSIETKEAYHVVSSTEALRRTWVASFREWLLSECAIEDSSSTLLADG